MAKRKMANGMEEREGNYELMSAMNQLLDHSRSQTAMMTDLQNKVQSMESEIHQLRGTITMMEQAVGTMQHNTITSSSLDKVSSDICNQIRTRLDSVENRQKYHEILLKHQKWTHPDKPAIATFGREADMFFNGIQESTCDMRYGNKGGVSVVSVDGRGARHNEAFKKHWTEFSDALKDHHYALVSLLKDEYTLLRIYDIEMPRQILDLLSKSLKGTHFKGFCLDKNILDRYGIQWALDHVENNLLLEFFSLDYNKFEHVEDVDRLCNIIKNHPKLDGVTLEGSLGRSLNSYAVACSIFTSGVSALKVINLACNNIRTGGDTFISEFIKSNPMLEDLNLESNELDDHDSSMFADALKHNTNLRRFSFDYNPMTEIGLQEMLYALNGKTSLNIAADSNHTCSVDYPNDEDSLCLQSRHEPLTIRAQKIYSILSSRNRENCNADYFDDVPVEILPDLLEATQQYSQYFLQEESPCQDRDDCRALSIVFEIMLRWDKALAVFEYAPFKTRPGIPAHLD